MDMSLAWPNYAFQNRHENPGVRTRGFLNFSRIALLEWTEGSVAARAKEIHQLELGEDGWPSSYDLNQSNVLISEWLPYTSDANEPRQQESTRLARWVADWFMCDFRNSRSASIIGKSQILTWISSLISPAENMCRNSHLSAQSTRDDIWESD